MAGINRVILVGRLGKDPETREVNGKTVCNFQIATSEEWKDKQTGEKQERVEWHKIEAWDRLGEVCAQYLRKGSQVYIEGNLKTRKSTGKDGIDRYNTNIKANTMQMLDSKKDSPQQTAPEIPQAESVPDDTIPF